MILFNRMIVAPVGGKLYHSIKFLLPYVFPFREGSIYINLLMVSGSELFVPACLHDNSTFT